MLCRVNTSGHAGQSGSTSWCIRRQDPPDKLKPLTAVLCSPTFGRGGIRRGWALEWLSSSVFDVSTELILKSSLIGPSWPQTSLRCSPVTYLSSLLPPPVSPPSHQDLLRQWLLILMTSHLSLFSAVAHSEYEMESVHWDVRQEREDRLVDWR